MDGRDRQTTSSLPHHPFSLNTGMTIARSRFAASLDLGPLGCQLEGNYNFGVPTLP